MPSFIFDAGDYGPAVQHLWSDRLCELGPGAPARDVADQLASLTVSELFQGQQVVDRGMAQCCQSGLWLLYDYLDESHTISQDVSSTSGSYWHGIMHRREPDYSNAKYWFRRVGEHPVFADLGVAAAELAAGSADQSLHYLLSQATWDPFRFVDTCQQLHGTHSDAERRCREIARIEWQILFNYCYRAAV